MDNATAHALLRKQIDRLRALPERLRAEAPPLVAAELDRSIRVNIAAARAPDGTPWAPTKAGEKPLKNAGKALTVKTQGTVVLARVTGPEALHHFGRVAGKVRRQILPTSRVPATLTAAIRSTLARLYVQIVSGP